MKNILVALFAVLLPFTAMAQDDLDAKYATEMLKPGTPAPAIMVERNGKQVNLIDEYKGKYLLLDFWASWCGDCRREMKYMRSINRTFASDSIRIVGYSFDKEKAPFDKCVTDSVLAWRHELSPVPMRESPVAADYHVKWIPSYYLIDKEGRILLATVMIDKLMATLRDIAPEAKPDDGPLSSTYPFRQETLMEMMTAFSHNIQYPEMCQSIEATGRVFVEFVINTDGSVSDIVVKKVEDVKIGKLSPSATAQSVEKMRERCAKQFAKAAVDAIHKVDKDIFKRADNGRGRIKLVLPASFRF